MNHLDSSWRDRTVVITGATAGVGRALTQRFAREGAKLGLIARDREALAELQIELEHQGCACHTVATDVADADGVMSAAKEIAERLGPIDLWINNAMTTVFSSVLEMTPAEFRRVTEVTYLGYVYGTMAALHQMRARDRGAIVQVGSALAYRGIPLQSAYCGAKHGIRGFTDSLRSELIRDKSGIKLTMVQLPAVNTPQFDWARTHRFHEPRPVPPVFEPEAIADAILRAAGEMRREYWIGTSTIKVVLGSMLVPGYLDRYLARKAYDAQDRKTMAPLVKYGNLFRPQHDKHRTRGSFSAEAQASVAIASGATIRAWIFAGAAACCCFVIGAAALI